MRREYYIPSGNKGGVETLPVIDIINANYPNRYKSIINNSSQDGLIYIVVETGTTVGASKTLVVCDSEDILATKSISLSSHDMIGATFGINGYFGFFYSSGGRNYKMVTYQYAYGMINTIYSSSTIYGNWLRTIIGGAWSDGGVLYTTMTIQEGGREQIHRVNIITGAANYGNPGSRTAGSLLSHDYSSTYPYVFVIGANYTGCQHPIMIVKSENPYGFGFVIDSNTTENLNISRIAEVTNCVPISNVSTTNEVNFWGVFGNQTYYNQDKQFTWVGSNNERYLEISDDFTNMSIGESIADSRYRTLGTAGQILPLSHDLFYRIRTDNNNIELVDRLAQ